MRGIRLINWKIIYPDNTVFICKTIFLQKERITGIEKKDACPGKDKRHKQNEKPTFTINSALI